MLARIVRSIATLVAVVFAYQLYVQLAVPYLEPPMEARVQRRSTAAERAGGRRLIDKYQRLLAAYFPADHWTQQRPPKVIESGPGMLVLDEYRQHEGRRIELSRCALLYFPTPRDEVSQPPRDAVIVEAPQGARLEFDGEFNPARGELGQIVRGEFPGLITIRSDMREPGSEDDLLLETSDLRMNSKLLMTESKVRFRLGPNAGEGQHLEIRFLEDEQPSGAKKGLKFSGVESLEIRNDVMLQLYLDAKSFLAPDESANRQQPSPADSHGATQPVQSPLELSCTGSFRFDMRRFVASFDENVEVWQLNPNGPSDQLSCQQLEIHFATADAEPSLGGYVVVDPARQQRQELGRLEPVELVATGFPVVMVSPARGAEARGQRVRLKLRERQVALDGGRDVRLRYGDSVLRAPSISYTHPAEDADTRVGSFRAQGAGTLEFAPNPSKPQQLLRAKWHDSVELARKEGQPILTMAGRPEFSMEGRGQLIADVMMVYFHELPQDEPAAAAFAFQTADGKTQNSRVIPDRLSATGDVVINSPQLSGQTHELAVWFRYEPDAQAEPNETQTQDRFAFAEQTSPAGESYAIQADRLRLEVALRGRSAVPTNLACNGNVVFREMVTRDPADAPLVLHGQTLTVEDIDTGATRVAVLGAESDGQRAATPAEMTARGVTLISRAVYLDEGQNRAWIPGAGEAHVKLDRDLQGQPVATPYPLKIRWEQGLTFHRRQVELRGNVLVEGPNDWLRCGRLVGTLQRELAVGNDVATRSLELAEVQCQDNVVVDHQSRDVVGLTSHERMELDQLVINQQSGAISGSGPGWVRSVHYSAELGGLATPANDESPTDGSTSSASQRLHFLRVNFQQGISGNLHRRELTFLQRVRAVYGPIDSWEQQLDPIPDGLPPLAIALQCDELTVNEDPTARRLPTTSTRGAPELAVSIPGASRVGPVELVARGNVRIEGSSSADQTFIATAQRATYNKLKDVFRLEGDGRRPATIWRQSGNEPLETAAGKIIFHISSDKVEVEDFRSWDFSPAADSTFGPRPAGRPTIPPR